MPGPTIYLFSFGYKFDGPPRDDRGHGGGFVFDCRALPNPFWDEALRPFAGTDPSIVRFFEGQPDVAEYYAHCAQLVRYTADTYVRLGRESLMVSFGCTGGRHRSVYLAETMQRALALDGYSVVLSHRDLHRSGPAPVREAAL